VACWSTKVAISLKRVKIEEKLPWRAYRKSQMLFRTVPSPTPYGLPFLKIGGSQRHPKTAIAIISGTAKATDCKFTGSIRTQAHEKFWRKNLKRVWAYPGTAQFFSFIGSIRTKAPYNLREKGAWAYPGTAQIFSLSPIISRTGKATNFQFCTTHILSIDRNKSPLQISGKVAVC